jgi:hypothetical protein
VLSQPVQKLCLHALCRLVIHDIEEIISKISRAILFWFVKIYSFFVYLYIFQFDRFFINFYIPSSKDSQVTTKYQRKTAQKIKLFHRIFNNKFYRNLINWKSSKYKNTFATYALVLNYSIRYCSFYLKVEMYGSNFRNTNFWAWNIRINKDECVKIK